MTLTKNEQSLFDLINQHRTDRTTTEGKNAERGVDLPAAYRIQAAGQSSRVLKGYKFGLVSPAKQQQMGINTPLYGRIYADMLFQNCVPLGNFIQPRLEPEVAVVLRDAITPDMTVGAIARCVGGYFLGVDILDSVWKDYKFTAPEVVADNTSGGGFVLSERMTTTIPDGSLRLYLNGEMLATGLVVELGNPLQKLQWLAGEVGGLGAGMIIFLGSPAASIPAQAGTLEVVDSDGSALIVVIRE